MVHADDVADAIVRVLEARVPGAFNLASAPAITADDIAVVLVARDDDGTPVGCGALRPLEPGAAELKRMYVVPAARGRGISRLLLVALEAEAAAWGWTTLRLETGTRQPAAVGLYTAAGYRPVEAFGHYVTDDTDDSLYFARVLA
jgi:GNAT superfamily N-acetyltransferase